MRAANLMVRGLGLCLCWLVGVRVASAEPPSAASQHGACVTAHAEAQLSRMKGAFLAAREQLLVCGQSECPAPIANDCAAWLAEVEASLSSVVFAVSDEQGRDIADARVSANGRLLAERTDGRALELDAGTYTFTFSTPQRTPVERTLAIRQSEKNRIIRVELSGPRAPTVEPVSEREAIIPAARVAQRSVPVATYILGGVALVGLGGFTYFGLAGNGTLDDIKACRSGCQALADRGEREYIAADVALGVAVVSLASAAIVYFTSQKRTREATQAQRLVPRVDARGAGLEWHGRF